MGRTGIVIAYRINKRFDPRIRYLTYIEAIIKMYSVLSETHQPQSKPGADVLAGVNVLVGCEGAAPPNKDDIISPSGFAA